MVRWQHLLNGHEFGWILGVGDGQGGLGCCNSWGCKELDMTERLNWLNWWRQNNRIPKTVRCWWKKSKMTETNGKLYHVFILEESILSKWPYHSRINAILVQIINGIFLKTWGESREELNSLLMKVKEENEKAGLKLSIQKSKIMHPVPSLFGNYMGK